MNVYRRIDINTDDFRVGDQISIGHYTATCQKIEGDGCIFLLDQYLDEAMSMNEEDTNKGGYEASDLIIELNSDEILKVFDGLKLTPFKNGDLLRIPYYGEMFGHDGWYRSSGVEPDDCEQWVLMMDRRNRVADRRGEAYEWGWLQNKQVRSLTTFSDVDNDGTAGYWDASNSIGVRPVFKINCEVDE